MFTGTSGSSATFVALFAGATAESRTDSGADPRRGLAANRQFSTAMMSPSLLAIARSLGLALFFIALSARSALADPHTEAAAKDAQTKAQAEYTSANYAGAATRLQAALRACAPARCSPTVRAALLRDLGVMQFRSGDKDGAGKSFGDAIALQQTITLDPTYDASDVGAAFEDQRAIAGLPAGPVSTKPPPGAKAGAPTPGPGAAGGAGAPPAGPLGEQPTGGDFVHEPPLEQKENTPLPIYAEYSGSSPLAHVVVKYKGAQMREWLRVDMRKEGNGWAALLPCADVTRGVMHYWIQAFDRTGEPVAASGDPKHPFYVPIREKLTGEAPHLPGKEPPRSCDDTDCPPGIAGCKAKGEGPEGGAAPGAGAGAAAAGEGEASGGAAKASGLPPGAYPRIWVGASFAMDFLVLPGASDVCRVKADSTPVNAQGYYCFGGDPVAGSNSNFPSRSSVNATIVDGGTVPGGFTVGDLRLTATLDYAIAPNILAGLRFGYAFNSYPGRAAAFPSRLHIEARGTYVFGQAPLARPGFAPMLFGGLGAAEFDGRTTTHDVLVNDPRFPGQHTEDAWLSNGPFFLVFGGGARYQASRRLAVTGALRLNLSFGTLGLLPTFGPEVGALYGF